MSRKPQKPRKTKKPSTTRYGPELRQTVLERMKSGANVTALAREFGIKRTRLYKWKDAEAARTHSVDPADSVRSIESDSNYESKIAKLRQQIADLERLVGQQTVAIGFFENALRHLEEIRQKNLQSGVISSFKKSER